MEKYIKPEIYVIYIRTDAIMLNGSIGNDADTEWVELGDETNYFD